MPNPKYEEVDKAYRTIVADLKRKGWGQLVITLQKNGDDDFHLHFLQAPRKD